MADLNEALRRQMEGRLYELKLEHRDLDLAILRLIEDPLHDQFALQRMKKRKLLLKDQIDLIVRQLDPDIRA
jgi:hypothetical protein